MLPKITINRYQLNSFLWTLNFLILSFLYAVIVKYKLEFLSSSIMFLLLIYFWNLNLNLLHIASHGGLSKNRMRNNIMGTISALISGFSFQVFTQIHILHHKNLGNEDKDPDHILSRDHRFYLIPIRIWMQDFIFWSRGLAFTKLRWLEFFFTRFMQIGILVLIFYYGFGWVIINWWLPVMLINGYLYSMYQFYFPHYHKWDKILMNDWPVWGSFWKWSINLCRDYHDKHHQKIYKNSYYFPFELGFFKNRD